MENFGKKCGGFSALYIYTKVPDGEAYQSAMLISACIVVFDMQGGSCSNIILYTGVKKKIWHLCDDSLEVAF